MTSGGSLGELRAANLALVTSILEQSGPLSRADLMRRTGLANAAGRYGLKSWGNVRLERLLADPPELLLGGQAAPGQPTWADRVGRHPALAAIAGRMQRDVLPEKLMYCGGPVFLPAVERLAAARDRYLGRKG